MQIGLERIAAQPALTKEWGNCGLVANQASVTKSLQPAWEVCREFLDKRLRVLFGPQHGFESTVQENMIETGHGRHLPTGLPVHSLYSETREPTAAMLAGIDTIIVDLQNVGTRVYTYKYTLAGCLRAAKKFDKRVVVLDRPNPLGGETIEGLVLESTAKSFVGEFEIPMRHGLTMGEAAQFFNETIKANLHVVEMSDYQPSALWPELYRPWVLTSPNIPGFDAVSTFPGTVLLEGTNISEGRGTTLPFQFIGAPYVSDAEKLVARIEDFLPKLAGVFLRPTSFIPVAHKGANQVCNGFQLHILDPRSFFSFHLGVAIIRSFIELYPNEFQWRSPPYEYDYHSPPINILVGSQKAQGKFSTSDFDVADPFWVQGMSKYIERVKGSLIYPRRMREILA